jgi:hypothetical protein
MAIFYCQDTGYRSADWDDRPPICQRLDYHDYGVEYAVDAMLTEMSGIIRTIEGGYPWTHTRNVLVRLLRRICVENYKMSAEKMQVVINSLADQAFREDKIRQFNRWKPSGEPEIVNYVS